MTKAFVMLTADRAEVGVVTSMGGAVQQETRLYQGADCVCTLLVTYPAGSPVYEQFHAGRRLDDLPRVNAHSVASDAAGAA